MALRYALNVAKSNNYSRTNVLLQPSMYCRKKDPTAIIHSPAIREIEFASK